MESRGSSRPITVPACTIVPMVPQPGSGTRNTFLADLQKFNSGVPVTLGANVRQGIEENDPFAITNLSATDAPNAIVPFSGGRLNLWNKGYFHNPHTPFNNNPFPGGAPLTPGIALQTGTAPDASPGHGLPQLAGLMFWLTRKALSGSYCALARASRS